MNPATFFFGSEAIASSCTYFTVYAVILSLKKRSWTISKRWDGPLIFFPFYVTLIDSTVFKSIECQCTIIEAYSRGSDPPFYHLSRRVQEWYDKPSEHKKSYLSKVLGSDFQVILQEVVFVEIFKQYLGKPTSQNPCSRYRAESQNNDSSIFRRKHTRWYPDLRKIYKCVERIFT